jgi:tetratricopeptide (TPR) repeat protein
VIAAGRALGTLLVSGSLLVPSWLEGLLPRPHLPAAVERWLWNPRERTEREIEAWGRGDVEAAARPAETALRLAPEDPAVQFNAGTARLAAGSAKRAVEPLEKAARAAGPALAPAAHYNLGSARLAAGDAAGAVEALEQALRLQPGNADAKFNLELALRERERDRLRAKAPQTGSRGDRSGDRDESKRPGTDDPGERGKSDTDPGQGDPRPGDRGRPDRDRQQGAQGGGRGLPRFEEQPEMSAAEAAAILQSVENLERQQRREAAARLARKQAAEGKDW